MTAPEAPRPRSRTASGTGVDEETLHLPLTTPGPAARPTAPSPYPPRAPFQPPPAPSSASRRPLPRPVPERWEGTGFRPDVQGLRAVAVMLVLLSHAGFAFASGGYVGVDVFFVISGFLITSLLVKEMFDTGKISLAGFFSRRARRILPAATVVTVASVVGVWLWFPVTRFEEVMRDAFTVVTYVVNYRFVVESNEYLNADQMPSPFQQYWSLAVEEQFYLLWPLLLLALLVWCKRLPRKALNAAIALTVVVFVLSLIASVLVTEASRPTAYYATHTRAWELAAGAFLALTLPTWKKIPQVVAFLLGFAGLAAILAAAYTYDDQTAFPGYTALLPVAGTMLLIVAGTGKGANHVSALLSTGPFQFIGKISYSLYLWHWPVLILFPLALGIESSLLLNVALLLATFGLAQITYNLVEAPFRTGRVWRSHPFIGIGTGLLCSLLALTAVVVVTVVKDVDSSQDYTEPEIDFDDDTAITEQLTAGAEVQSLPEDLVPPLESVVEDYPLVFSDGCFLGFDAVGNEPGDCVYGNPDSETTVVLFGDSHAAQWFPALEAIAVEQDWRLVVRSKASCPVPEVSIGHPTEDRDYSECDQWRGAVMGYLVDLRPDMLVATSSVFYDLGGDDPAAAWADGWDESLADMAESGAEIVALTDTPRTPWNVPDCLSTHVDTVPECVPEREDALPRADLRESGTASQAEFGATVIDVVPWFCLESVCPVVVDDIQVYRDRNHMTASYVGTLAPLLLDRLPVQ